MKDKEKEARKEEERTKNSLLGVLNLMVDSYTDQPTIISIFQKVIEELRNFSPGMDYGSTYCWYSYKNDRFSITIRAGEDYTIYNKESEFKLGLDRNISYEESKTLEEVDVKHVKDLLKILLEQMLSHSNMMSSYLTYVLDRKL